LAAARDGLADLAAELLELAPRFGRARDGVEALAARAREGDARGAVREARRVAGEVERAAGGHLPAHALARLAAVGAAKAGPEDAVAAVAAAIALLRWYADAVPETVVSVAAPAPAPERPRAVWIAVAVALAAAAAALLVRRAAG
jgi:hypothetical protein